MTDRAGNMPAAGRYQTYQRDPKADETQSYEGKKTATSGFQTEPFQADRLGRTGQGHAVPEPRMRTATVPSKRRREATCWCCDVRL